MNAVQQVLISAIHAGALDLTKTNADAVLALYRSMHEFVASVPKPDDELLADYKAVEHWLFFAMRKGAEVPGDVTDDELRSAALWNPDNVVALNS